MTILAAAALLPSPSRAGQEVRQSFDLTVPFAPSPTPVGDGLRLTYELHATNFARSDMTLLRISVIDGETGAALAVLEGRELGAVLRRPGANLAEEHATVRAGQRTVLYVDLPVTARPPRSLTHRIEFEVRGAAASGALVGGAVAVSRRTLQTLSPPLRGGPWVAAYQASLDNGHRRYVYATEGSATIPGRHAVDWMRPLAPGGQVGPEGDGRGEDVLAVADAKVVASRDDMPEPEPGAARPRVALSDATGNYVALDLENGTFAFYEHLMPGLRVKTGERVRRGQVIGRVGSTGSASRPHLHFHLADRNSPLGAEGLPYLLAGWRRLGGYPSIEAFERGGPWAERQTSPVPVLTAFPPPNVVVAFDGRRVQGSSGGQSPNRP